MALVFVDIDTQFDFMDPQGKLYVPGAEKLEENLRRLTETAREHGVLVIATADNHPEDAEEFQEWPPHCVMGTPGQLKMPYTSFADPFRVPWDNPPEASRIPLSGQVIIEKNALSCFTNPSCDAYLRRVAEELGREGPVRFVVYGVATDYCVRAATLGLRERGYPVMVVEDAIAGVSEETTKKALEEMRQAGAEFVSTEQVIRMLKEATAGRAAAGTERS